MRTTSPDIEVQNHGTIVLLRPLTEHAQEWFDERVEHEGWNEWCGSIACEPRMASIILTAYYHESIDPEVIR